MSVEDLAERVKRGATYLDERKPGWADEIDVHNLAMLDGCRCILGQLYGWYSETVFELNGRDPAEIENGMDMPDDLHRWAVDHGFHGASLAGLKAFWLAEIKARTSGEALHV